MWHCMNWMRLSRNRLSVLGLCGTISSSGGGCCRHPRVPVLTARTLGRPCRRPCWSQGWWSRSGGPLPWHEKGRWRMSVAGWWLRTSSWNHVDRIWSNDGCPCGSGGAMTHNAPVVENGCQRDWAIDGRVRLRSFLEYRMDVLAPPIVGGLSFVWRLLE